jgi:hypothetical protein
MNAQLMAGCLVADTHPEPVEMASGIGHVGAAGADLRSESPAMLI